MKVTWVVTLKGKHPVIHAAGLVSHIYIACLDAGRFYEEIEDRRKAEVMPSELGVRKYDMCKCGTC